MRLQNHRNNRIVRYSIGKTMDVAIKLIGSASDNNLIRLTYLLERLAPSSIDARSVRIVREAFNSGHPSVELAKRIGRDISSNYRRGFASFLVNKMFLDAQTRTAYRGVYGDAPPFTILISPTMRCNLKCKGCFAGEYSNEDDLPKEVVQRIIDEGSEIGIGMYTILGGEPFMYKSLLSIAEQNPQAIFQVFTNGTLVEPLVVEKLAKLGNVILVLSVEGLKHKTDKRRGQGTFAHIISVADMLRESGAPFMFSVTPTRENLESTISDEFIDLMVKKGAVLGWYFSYMPVGRKPDLSLMLAPEQRDRLRRRISELRATKPILLIDFWGDGPLTDGCLAGGRQFVHINNFGDVEPCIFCHMATHNIKDHSLVDVLNSDFFKAIRKAQPFGRNHLRPCPMIDHPGAMAGLAKRCGAHSTHDGAEKILKDFIPELRNYSVQVKNIYEDAWATEYEWYKRWTAI